MDVTIDIKENASEVNLPEWKNVAVFIEQRNGIISGISYEMLGEGRKLADHLNEKLVAIILGDRLNGEAANLIKFGADRVVYCEGPDLVSFTDETYSVVMAEVIKEEKPAIVLAGASAIGRSFIPRIAAKFHAGLTADCVKLEINPDNRLLLSTRPVFGGNLMTTVISPNNRPQMATVRRKAMKPATMDPGRFGEIIKKSVSKGSVRERCTFLGTVKEAGENINITEADIIVSGGRGMGGPENFQFLRDLAGVLGGALGASRAAVDAGWVPYSHQVGLTGRTVCPKIYIACGISGSVQHMAGMQSSDYIIAINKDPDADIFQIANLGIVGNALEILPALTSAIDKPAVMV